MNSLSGGVAGAFGVLFSNPFDVAKVRLQLQGEMAASGQHAVHYRGIVHAFYVIAKSEGALALYKGLGPAMCFQVAMNGPRLGLYHTAEANGWIKGKDGQVHFGKSFLWSSISGMAGYGLSTPLQMVKVQMQSMCNKGIVVGHQHAHRNTADACRTIYKANGIRGLYATLPSSLLQGFFASSAQLTTFSMSKSYLFENEICSNSIIAMAFLASCISGVAGTIAMCPADVVATRLFNQSLNSKNGPVYKGVLDCITKIYEHEGFFAFYKGYKAMYLRLAPQITVSFVTWDWLNNLKRQYYDKT